MKAVVLLASIRAQPGTQSFTSQTPELSTLVDRPFIRHVVEFIIDQGIHELDLVLGRDTKQISELLGDGSRWGAEFNYHFAQDEEEACWLAAGLLRSGDYSLLAQGDRLPLVSLRPSIQAARTTLVYTREPHAWTGWAVLSNGDAWSAPYSAKELEWQRYFERRGAARIECDATLATGDVKRLWKSNCDLLDRHFAGVLVTGREVKPGVWIGRNVSLHADANVTAPAYIGENSRIGPSAQIGPFAVVARDCLIARRTRVVSSVVNPRTYVGNDLELDHVFADRGLLFNVLLDAPVENVDGVLLDSLFSFSWTSLLRRIAERIAAAALLVLMAIPVLIYALCVALKTGRSPCTRLSVVELPAPQDESRWKTVPLWSLKPVDSPGNSPDSAVSALLGCVGPALFSAVCGWIGLSGSAPMEPEEIKLLRSDQRETYLREGCGAFGFLRSIKPEPRELVTVATVARHQKTQQVVRNEKAAG